MFYMKKSDKKTLRRPYTVAGLLIALILLAALAGCSLSNAPSDTIGVATPVPAQTADTQEAAQSESKDLVISVGDVSEKALFIPVKADGVDMEVIAVQAPDGSIRTAFNTCQVCFDSGRGYYVQEGDELVCQNCGNRFPMDEVEITRGGCNPVPIPEDLKTVTADTITIPYDLLQQAKELFSKWKTA